MQVPSSWKKQNQTSTNAKSRDIFVGRAHELNELRQALDDESAQIFYISGQGGVGKTKLLERLQEMARERGYLILSSDERQGDIPGILAHFALQLGQLGYSPTNFLRQYELYRQARDEIARDPNSPQEMAGLTGQGLARVGIYWLEKIPGVDIGVKVAEQAIVEQVDRFSRYIGERFRGQPEVILLLHEPVERLSQAFFADLHKVIETRRILLSFDNFEFTRNYLDPWLSQLANYNPSPRIYFAFAGRTPPGPLLPWNVLGFYTLHVPLDFFTDQEASDFLDQRSITDLKRREEILRLANKLPVLMDWLATATGTDDDATPVDNVVERYLRWVNDDMLRQTALDMALVRSFNMDDARVVLAAMSTTDQELCFDWLIKQPFVIRRETTWSYHPVVRELFLHHRRNRGLQTYRQLHEHLASNYATECAKIEPNQWTNDNWCNVELKRLYHHVLSNPAQNWNEALSSLCENALGKSQWEVLWLSWLLDEIWDEEIEKNKSLISDYQMLRTYLPTPDRFDSKSALPLLEHLCSHPELSAMAKYTVLRLRMATCFAVGDYTKVLVDATHGLEIKPDLAELLAIRGATYLAMGQYKEALVDVTRAIEFDPTSARIIGCRGVTYGQMGQYEEALVDLSRAIELDPNLDVAIANRGLTYWQMGRNEEALVDFNRAIELDPTSAWIIGSRGLTYQLIGQYEEALVDLSRVIELDPNLDWAIANRGETYRRMGRYEEAVVDLTRAIGIHPNYAFAIGSRGRTYRLMGRHEEALIDLSRAIELDPNYTWAIANRGEAYRQMGRNEEALINFNRAIELDPNYTWAIGSRSEARLFLNDFKTALVDAEVYVRHQPSSDWAYYILGLCKQMTGNTSEAMSDFREAYSLATEQVSSPNSVTAFNQGLYLLAFSDTESAVTHFRMILAQSPTVVALSAGLFDLSLYIHLFPENETATLLHRELQNALNAIKVAE